MFDNSKNENLVNSKFAYSQFFRLVPSTTCFSCFSSRYRTRTNQSGCVVTAGGEEGWMLLGICIHHNEVAIVSTFMKAMDIIDNKASMLFVFTFVAPAWPFRSHATKFLSSGHPQFFRHATSTVSFIWSQQLVMPGSGNVDSR